MIKDAYLKKIAEYRVAKVGLELATMDRFPLGSWWMYGTGEGAKRVQVTNYCTDPDHVAVKPDPYLKNSPYAASIRVEELTPDKTVK